jgi:UDP-glucose 4-epimerase
MSVNSITECCLHKNSIINERILIFGGSGSLGTCSVRRWIKDNQVMNVSRDEEKQWLLRNTIRSENLTQMIGDITNQDDVDKAILQYKPTIVCIFACLKHIELCEKFPQKAISTNTHGIMNLNNTLMKFAHNVHTVMFVSTDKACLPITTYGCTKAISEFFLQGIESNPSTKWVGVRYGNVLNSSGSIIPFLHTNRHDTSVPYPLTHPEMTRFIMTLDQSVNLIEYAVLHGSHNELVIPHLYSMSIKDIFSLFEVKYNKTTVVTGLRCKEKIHEDLLSPSEADYSYFKDGYYHITNKKQDVAIKPFDSSMFIISKDVLQEYLMSKNLL